MADPRKAHITRVFGRTRESPEKLDDVYVDVRKFDEMEIFDPGTGQASRLEVYWEDGFGGNEPDDPDRILTTLKLTDPENPPDDPDDPDVYIPLKIIDQLTVKSYTSGPLFSLIKEAQDVAQETVLRFENKKSEGEDDTLRVVTSRRVTFSETSTVDERLNDGPIDEAEYHRDDETENEDQYIDAEFIDSHTSNDADQVTEHTWDNEGDELINEFEKTPEGEDPPAKPIRLDPFQQIVNVRWRTKLVLITAVASQPVDPDDDDIGLWRVIDSGDNSIIAEGTENDWQQDYVRTANPVPFTPSSGFEGFVRTSGGGNGVYVTGLAGDTQVIRRYTSVVNIAWTIAVFDGDHIRGGFEPQIAGQSDGVIITLNTTPPTPPQNISDPIYRKYGQAAGALVWQGDLTGHPNFAEYQDIRIAFISNVAKKKRT